MNPGPCSGGQVGSHCEGEEGCSCLGQIGGFANFGNRQIQLMGLIYEFIDLVFIH
jgi:hypothetical protein